MGEIPTLSWKRLSATELEQALKADPYSEDPEIDKQLLILVKQDLVTAWLDDRGQLRFQRKRECLKQTSLEEYR